VRSAILATAELLVSIGLPAVKVWPSIHVLLPILLSILSTHVNIIPVIRLSQNKLHFVRISDTKLIFTVLETRPLTDVVVLVVVVVVVAAAAVKW